MLIQEHTLFVFFPQKPKFRELSSAITDNLKKDAMSTTDTQTDAHAEPEYSSLDDIKQTMTSIKDDVMSLTSEEVEIEN